MKKIISALMASLLIFTLTGCSGKESSNEGKILDPREELNKQNGISTTVKKTKPVAPPVAAKPGEKVEPNSIKWRVVTEISDTCAAALKPFRDFEKKYPNGLARESMASKAETEAMNKAMTLVQSNRKVCSKEDFDLWYNEEYLGWSRSN